MDVKIATERIAMRSGRTNVKYLFAAVLFIALTVSAATCSETSDTSAEDVVFQDPESGLWFNADNTGTEAAVISSNNVEYSGNVTVPSSVTNGSQTYTVTSISASAFQDCDELTSIMIPSSVAEIADGAFQNCTGLVIVALPSAAIVEADEFLEVVVVISYSGENVTYITAAVSSGTVSFSIFTNPNTAVTEVAVQGQNGDVLVYQNEASWEFDADSGTTFDVTISTENLTYVVATPVQTPEGAYVITATADGFGDPIAVDTPFEFTVTLANGYVGTISVTSESGVTINPGQNNIYSVSGAVAAQEVTITISGAQPVYTVSYVTDNDTVYIVTPINGSFNENTDVGSDFVFTVVLVNGYVGPISVSDPNGVQIYNDGDMYTITGAQPGQQIQIDISGANAVYRVIRNINLGNGYVITSLSEHFGTDIPVGTAFTFKAMLGEGYTGTISVFASNVLIPDMGGNSYTVTGTAGQNIIISATGANGSYNVIFIRDTNGYIIFPEPDSGGISVSVDYVFSVHLREGYTGTISVIVNGNEMPAEPDGKYTVSAAAGETVEIELKGASGTETNSVAIVGIIIAVLIVTVVAVILIRR